MSSNVRVRFAPSPTGPLHIGGVRTALYNYLFAKKNKGTFILRIEDTDQTRYVEKAEEYIAQSLKWCGIEADESPEKGGEFNPYRQSERKDQYRQYAEQLLESGHAYYAFDTAEELEEMRERMRKQNVPSPQYNAVSRQYMKNSLALSADEVKKRLDNGEPYVIRAKLPRNEELRFEDEIRGWVVFNTGQLDDKVLFKSDGMPTYHLANVVDDHLMKITHVIRGEEWLPSAPLHVLLYRFFGWEQPIFAHLPLILKPDGHGKLSKRDGDRLGFPVFPLNWKDPETGEQSNGFKERGFFPDAFNNMLAFLGWNPGTNQEVFSKEELIETFSLERVGKSGAKFDFEKGKWFNQQYLKMQKPETLVELASPVLEKNGVKKDDAFLRQFVMQMVERVVFINDFWSEGKFYFQAPDAYEEKMIRKKFKPGKKEKFPELIKALKETDPFNAESIEQTVKTFMHDNELGFGDVLPIIRIAVSGIMQGPPIFEMAALIGKEETVNRLEKGLEAFEGIAGKD
ncbi:MAG: glutamate--tRNA ligase [Chitinophagales bacterium]